MHRNIIVVILCSALLVACSKRGQVEPGMENRSILEKIADEKGPKVDGINATFLKSAQQAENNGEYAKAAQLYEQFLNSSKSNEPEHIIAYAEALRRGGFHDASLKVYDLVPENDRHHVAAMEGKALALLANGQTEQAIKLFDKVMTLDAARWKTANALGAAYTLKQKPKEALDYYKLAADLTNNSNATILNNIGLTYALEKDYDKGVHYLEKASRVAEKAAQKRVDLNLSMVYGLRGDMERAASLARRHLSEAAVLNNLGMFAKMSDNDEMARSYLNMALNRNPLFYKKADDNLKDLPY